MLSPAGAGQKVSFERETERLGILFDGTRVATYVWDDPAIPRPYFCNILAPNGAQVTRNHPPNPVADKGNDDHPGFHPGIWLAFGDVDGQDYWRNKARVRHGGFITEPAAGDRIGHFEVLNVYEAPAGATPEVVCEERCRYTFHVTPSGYLLVVDSTFQSKDHPFTFGDQEEMGLGVRLATPLSVKHGTGLLENSEGGRNEEGTWGRSANWCAGLGRAGGAWLGMSVMVHPGNFRPSWFHSRDYGLIVANPFGKKAMTGPDDDAVPADSTTVDASETFRLRFGVAIFSLPGDRQPDLASLYEEYLSLSVR